MKLNAVYGENSQETALRLHKREIRAENDADFLSRISEARNCSISARQIRRINSMCPFNAIGRHYTPLYTVDKDDVTQQKATQVTLARFVHDPTCISDRQSPLLDRTQDSSLYGLHMGVL